METEIFNVDGERHHDMLVNTIQPKLSYSPSVNYGEWKSQIKKKFVELSGIETIAENVCPLNVQVIKEEEKDGYKQIAFTFDSEKGETVPCYLLIPNTGNDKYPVAITLQGHSTGFHNSVGIVKYDRDKDYQPRGQFAIQAVKNGFIALAIEQRGMGIRKTYKANRLPNNACLYASRIASGLGRTLIGERVWDVHKAIDALSQFPKCDMEKILITGNSGGGTASYYAACFDERIGLSVPSCSFCSYKESILSIAHCACNYIPLMYKYFDMQDLSCMIAPRKLTIVAGKEDEIFPIAGVRKGYAAVKAIYERLGVGENCRLVETPKEHWWCVELVWDTINEECKKLGWK